MRIRFRITSTLDDAYKNGIFRLAIDLKNHQTNTANLAVSYTLVDKDGKTVSESEQTVSVPSDKLSTVSFQQQLPDVQTWTSEAPNLYKLFMTVSRRIPPHRNQGNRPESRKR